MAEFRFRQLGGVSEEKRMSPFDAGAPMCVVRYLRSSHCPLRSHGGHLKPRTRSSIAWTTMHVFLFVFCGYSSSISSIFNRFEIVSDFPNVFNWGMSIRLPRGALDRKDIVKIRSSHCNFSSLALKFSFFCYPSNGIHLFRLVWFFYRPKNCDLGSPCNRICKLFDP